jgi:hypothetical protein
VSSYPGDTEVPWFCGKVVCAKCRGTRPAHRRATELEGSTRLNRMTGPAPAGNIERRGVMAGWRDDVSGK